ncbi:MAG TPA: ATP-binding protein [Syntrophales bacterium]|nr:ATP-binding protein [Syntrophales bacterium]
MNETEIEQDQYRFLQKSFIEFNKATERLQNSFANLEQKFQEINRELELKNEELKRTIAEKEDVKNYLRNILESLTTGVVVMDLDGRITTINSWAEKFFDLPQHLVAGRHIAELFGSLPDSERNFLSFGSQLPDTGKKVSMRDRIIEIFASPMNAGQGETIGTVLILRDITRVEKLEAMAKRTEKLTAMGEMAANIAHEIRNPLGSIELFASLLMKGIGDKEHQGRLSQIIASVKNMDNKISNLLLFTTQKHPLMRKVNLHRIIKEVLKFSDPIVRQEDIVLSVAYANADPCVRGDAEMLKQVLLNILLNAIQAMTDGGRLGIETVVSSRSEEEGDGSVEVRISDTGVGITADNLKKIFDPFFSTRERGSGLGLAIVHNIVHAHGGSIDVESTENEGTVFTITVPLFRESGKPEIIQYPNTIGDRHA